MNDSIIINGHLSQYSKILDVWYILYHNQNLTEEYKNKKKINDIVKQ